MLGDGAGEDGRICSACTEALTKQFEIGMPAWANVLLTDHLGWDTKNKLPFPSPPSTPHPRQYKTGTKMFMHVVILPAETFLLCPDKARMWLTSFGSTFSYRGETLIPVFHTKYLDNTLLLVTAEERWKEWMLVIPKLLLVSLKIQCRINFSILLRQILLSICVQNF